MHLNQKIAMAIVALSQWAPSPAPPSCQPSYRHTGH